MSGINRMIKRVPLGFIALFVLLAFVGCKCRHEWIEATCSEPRTCSLCGKTEGTAPGHFWIGATCTKPKSCSLCGETAGTAPGHSWVEATSVSPKICSVCQEMEPLPLPDNGQVFIGQDMRRGSTLTIRNAGESCYVKLKDSEYNDVFSFFVPAGETAVVPVPADRFYTYFAHGNDWYGPEYCFGKETSYSKDDELLDYVNYEWEYTLYPVSGGNFSETPITEDEF
jgi:hypothetical protein